MSFEEFIENAVFSATYPESRSLAFLWARDWARSRLTERYGERELSRLVLFMRFRALAAKVRAASEANVARLLTTSFA